MRKVLHFTEDEAKNYKGLFSTIDTQFAKFIVRFSTRWDPDIFLGAALVSRATANGDICLDLNSVSNSILSEKKDGSDTLTCPPLSRWQEKLCSSPAVGKPGDKCPLILDHRNRLYLHRYWEYETKLSDAIKERVKGESLEFNSPKLKQHLKKLFPENEDPEINWQKVAAIIAILKRFSVITGGPGSGKTFTVAAILALMLECTPKAKLNIYLTAPTGKAAARLGETIRQAKQHLNCNEQIKNAIPCEAYTIHRLLKPIAGTPYFRQNFDNPLRADVVVVDEASMVDLALMSKLVQAVASDAKLLLVGDKDQLASVESGSVLGDICDRHVIHGFSRSFLEKMEHLTGLQAGAEVKMSQAGLGLQDCICVLQKNYRFSAQSGIGGLSRTINRGDVEASLALLKNTSETSIEWHEVRANGNLTHRLARMIVAGYRNYLTINDPVLAMVAFGRFKILCALRIGPFGVNSINRLAEQALSRENLILRDRP
ncbi:MAG: exodeoxyribonuclease V subunit alpha [Deltaproteobacteria bacterium]|nr:exodeoxyribonuclease V subunit alpha [Deltaproteobacteria bacterium]